MRRLSGIGSILRRFGVLSAALALLLALSACGGNGSAQWKAEFRSYAGNGFFWDCQLSNRSIVKYDVEQEQPKNLVNGALIRVKYIFEGVREGSTDAVFVYSCVWNPTITFTREYAITVSDDLKVSAQMGQTKALVNMGDPTYTAMIEDGSIIQLLSEDSGSFVFSSLQEGRTLITFSTPNGEAPLRQFEFIVAEDLMISALETEPEETQSGVSYDTFNDIGEALGFTVQLPETEIEVSDMSSAGGLACISFTWSGKEFTYVGGPINVNDIFVNFNAQIRMIRGVQVAFLTYEDGTALAAWEADGASHYISSIAAIDRFTLETLIDTIIADHQT